MSCVMALVALGIGYIVLLHANKEKERLKLLGQVIAILIMLGAVCSALCSAMKCEKYSKAPMCPVTVKTAEDPQK